MHPMSKWEPVRWSSRRTTSPTCLVLTVRVLGITWSVLAHPTGRGLSLLFLVVASTLIIAPLLSRSRRAHRPFRRQLDNLQKQKMHFFVTAFAIRYFRISRREKRSPPQSGSSAIVRTAHKLASVKTANVAWIKSRVNGDARTVVSRSRFLRRCE